MVEPHPYIPVFRTIRDICRMIPGFWQPLFASTGLIEEQYHLLREIVESPPQTTAQLANAHAMSRQAVTANLHPLLRRRLVRRQLRRGRSRALEFVPTPEGEALVDLVVRQANTVVERFAGGETLDMSCTLANLRYLHNLLDRIRLWLDERKCQLG